MEECVEWHSARTLVTPCLCFLWLLRLKRMKNTPASRWLQFSTSPTSVKYSVHICILHDYGKQGKQRIKKTDVYRHSCHPLTNILPSISSLQSCWYKSNFAWSSTLPFLFCTCHIFPGLDYPGLLSVKLLDLEFFK